MTKNKILISILISSIFVLGSTVQAFADIYTTPDSAVTVDQEDIYIEDPSSASSISQDAIIDAIQKAKETPISEVQQSELKNIVAGKAVVPDPKSSSTITIPGVPIIYQPDGISTDSTTTSKPSSYSTRKGVILVTADLPLGHSAIVYSSNQVVESISSGVSWGKNNWYATKNSVAQSTCKSTSAAQDASAADWCKGQLGKPYNPDFYNMATRKKFYCSQLVWASFNDKYSIDLNTNAYDLFVFGVKVARAIAPVELASNNKVYVIYRQNWYNS